MSIKAMVWALDLKVELTPAEKLTLVAIADHADQNNFCWPSHKLTAARVGVSVSTIKRCIRHMEDLGLLRRIPRNRANGSQASNGYVLVLGGQNDPGAAGGPGAPVTSEPPLTPSPNPHLFYDDSAESSLDEPVTTEQAPPQTPPAKRDKWGILESERRPVRDAIVHLAHQPYRSEAYDVAFLDFRSKLSEVYGEDFAGYADNKWSVHPSAGTPNAAGKELNTLIATAMQKDLLPAPVPAR